MAITLADFTRIWASTSPLTPYSFSDSNYEQGWNFVGATPPARQMWDSIQKQNDEKMKYIVDNFLPTAGGTMTGTTYAPTEAIYSSAENNDSTLVIGGGHDIYHGGQIVLVGENYGSNSGNVIIRARNNNGYKEFTAGIDGNLTWDGHSVLTNGVVGTAYKATWTASTSTANNTPLTNTISNVPIGVYILEGKLPVISTSSFYIQLTASNITYLSPSDGFGLLNNQCSAIKLISVVSATNSMRLSSAQSGACDFTYLERGGLSIVRIA